MEAAGIEPASGAHIPASFYVRSHQGCPVAGQRRFSPRARVIPSFREARPLGHRSGCFPPASQLTADEQLAQAAISAGAALRPKSAYTTLFFSSPFLAWSVFYAANRPTAARHCQFLTPIESICPPERGSRFPRRQVVRYRRSRSRNRVIYT